MSDVAPKLNMDNTPATSGPLPSLCNHSILLPPTAAHSQSHASNAVVTPERTTTFEEEMVHSPNRHYSTHSEDSQPSSSVTMETECGSHISCCVLCITTSCTNADPKCASSSAKLVSIESICGCNRGSARYSQPARYVPQTNRKHERDETLRMTVIHQSSLVSCKLACKMSVSRVQCNMLWYAK